MNIQHLLPPGAPRHFNNDIVWKNRKPREVRMVPKQQTYLRSFNLHNPQYFNNPTKTVHGDLYDRHTVNGAGIFDVLVKNVPWGKIFDIGSKVAEAAPHLLESGFKIADKFKKDPRVMAAKNREELITFFKELLAETSDTKERMEIIREIGKLKTA